MLEKEGTDNEMFENVFLMLGMQETALAFKLDRITCGKSIFIFLTYKKYRNNTINGENLLLHNFVIKCFIQTNENQGFWLFCFYHKFYLYVWIELIRNLKCNSKEIQPQQGPIERNPCEM